MDQDIGNVDELDRAIGDVFTEATLALLENANVIPAEVTAIGSHGQTLRHQPKANPPFSLQIGDPQRIADGTGLQTIADFRSADIAAGGEGAPLAPYFHEWLFRLPGKTRCVLNIGGVANVTVLTAEQDTIGFDTGPGNSLMDAWTRKHNSEPFDRDGRWAAAGIVDHDLLLQFMSDPYFAAAPPKSTGFEHFNLNWIEGHHTTIVQPADVQATLCQLTANTIADAIQDYAPETSEVLICGGGVHNPILRSMIEARLPEISLATTDSAGLDPDWVEAVAFAWLAMRHLQNLPGNLPSVTGASEPVVLGRPFLPA
jgi:anhydro-N-acetylmuramic acid kinase